MTTLSIAALQKYIFFVNVVILFSVLQQYIQYLPNFAIIIERENRRNFKSNMLDYAPSDNPRPQIVQYW